MIILLTGSILNALKVAYPEHKWHSWRFSNLSPESLDDVSFQRMVFEDVFNVKKPQEWYNIAYKAIRNDNICGQILMDKYSGSFRNALQAMYPDFEWQQWRFVHVAKGYWKDPNNVRQYMDHITKEFDIKNLDDWYGFCDDHIIAYGGATLLKYYGSLFDLLKSIYSHHNWDKEKWNNSSTSKKSQHLLLKRVKNLFRGETVLENHLHPNLLYEGSNKQMQLDIFIPDRNIALEYQGMQHYKMVSMFGGYHSQQIRDFEKKKACKELGIELICIPYWWDFKEESLAATLLSICPNLEGKNWKLADPISSRPN
jgi:hypothetical protein